MDVQGAAAEERTVHHVGEGDLDPFPRVVRRGNDAQRPGVVERAGQAGQQHDDERVELAGGQHRSSESFVRMRATLSRAGTSPPPATRRPPREDGGQRPEDRTVPFVESRVVADPAPQVLPIRAPSGVSGGDGLRRGADLTGHLPREAAEDILFAREVLVERHPRAVGPLRNPGDAAPMEALVAEELQRGIEDPLPGSLPSLPHLAGCPRRGRAASPARCLARRRRRGGIPSCHHDTVRTAPATGAAPGGR